MKKILLFVLILAVHSVAVLAQTNPTPQSAPYTQNFSSLAHTSTSYPAGWQGWVLSSSPSSSYNTAAPSSDRVLIASSTASVNSGNVHNYNGKIGFLNNGSTDLSLVLAVSTTGMNGVMVQYDIMTIRNPYDGNSNTRINEVSLQYRVGTTGSFTTISNTDYQSNTTTQISSITTPQNSTQKLVTLPSACNNQSVVQLRWVSFQVSGGGSRPSFAIDNVTVDTNLGSTTPTLSVTKTADAIEGSTPTAGTYTFSFNPSTSATTTFNYAITGTATFGTDYNMTVTGATPTTISSATGTITVPSSTSSFTATVTPINDANTEGTETIIITLTNPSGGYVFGDSVATMNLIDDEATYIHDIQGSGSTAVAGNYTVEAIVTGVYPTLSPAGFYIQEEDADADANANTSEGIFVVSNTNVSVGDKVSVAGTALESGSSPSFNQAVLNNTTVTILSSNNTLPTATTVTLPVTAASDYEKYEGMLVVINDTLTVTDNYNLGRYGEINLSVGGMVYQPTQIIDPNDATASGTTATGASNVAAVNALLADNGLRTILLDDGEGSMTTLPFVDATTNTLRLGSTLNSLTGILGYAYSVYRIQPVPYAYPTFNYAARPTTPPSVGANANVKIASFNVLNYFNGDGLGGGFPTARGAHSPAEFTRQRDKIINAIAAIDADVVGLIEIENDGTGVNSAVADLVNGLNAKMGAGTYSIINDGATIQANNTDAIRCAIIYKSAVVSPVGSVMISSAAIFDRPPVAHAFALVSNGQKFNFIINHFKSKGCSNSTGLDLDQMDGQSCYNLKRKSQAGELANFINTTVIPTSGSGMVLTVGDYNAYFEEDPLDSLRSLGYTVLGTSHKFSYLYFGQVGSLDNAVVTDSLKNKVTGVAKWNINSAEPVLLDYNDVINDGGGDLVNQWGNLYTDVPFRSSDHDPVIIGLELLPTPDYVATVAGASNISIYPNPAYNNLYINNKDGKALSWQMTNTLGQQVLHGVITEGQQNALVNISNMNSGVYIIRMSTANGASYTTRIVKQ